MTPGLPRNILEFPGLNMMPDDTGRLANQLQARKRGFAKNIAIIGVQAHVDKSASGFVLDRR